MKPRSYHWLDPGTRVTAYPRPPAVHDSAVASVRCCARRPAPSRSARRSMVPAASAAHANTRASNARHEQRVERGQQVVEHHAHPVLEALVHRADRRRLQDVEEAESEEGDGLRDHAARQQPQHEPEGDDLVDHDRAVIRPAERATRATRRRRPEDEGRRDHDRPAGVAQPRIEHDEHEPREQRAPGARRRTNEAAAEAERQLVRRMRQHQPPGRRLRDWRVAVGRHRRGSHGRK